MFLSFSSARRLASPLVQHRGVRAAFSTRNSKPGSSMFRKAKAEGVVLSGEGPPNPEAAHVGSAEDVLKTPAPKISTSKLKAVVFDMHVLLLDSAKVGSITRVGASDSWNTQNGVKGLMAYMHTRGLKCGLLPRFDMKDPELIKQGLEALSDQMDYKFTNLADNDPPSGKISASRFEANLAQFSREWSLEPNDIMVLSVDESLIKRAKLSGYFTCCLKQGGSNWQAAKAADWFVKNLPEVKLVVEELNGISFRNRELFFRG